MPARQLYILQNISSLICDVYLFDQLPAFAFMVAYMILCWDCPFYDKTGFLLSIIVSNSFYVTTVLCILISCRRIMQSWLSICINVGREDTA